MDSLTESITNVVLRGWTNQDLDRKVDRDSFSIFSSDNGQALDKLLQAQAFS